MDKFLMDKDGHLTKNPNYQELKQRNHNLGISVSNLLEENDYLKESIKHLITQNDGLLEENRQLKDFIEGWEYDLTPEFRAHFPNGIR